MSGPLTSEKSPSTPNSRPPITSTPPDTSDQTPVRGELVTKAGLPKKRVGELSYTQEVAGEIIRSIRGGMPIKMAAQFHRVPYRTVMDWLARGEKGEDPLEAFTIEVRQAQASFVKEMIDGIKAAGLDNAKQWTALMTLLERLYPEDFRRPTERTENLHLHGFVDGRIAELVEGGEVAYTGS